ncbi:MAG: hypothetical protein AVDCRST_MAG77-239, partial [uncultured Chloroflexi bacterium]
GADRDIVLPSSCAAKRAAPLGPLCCFSHQSSSRAHLEPHHRRHPAVRM